MIVILCLLLACAGRDFAQNQPGQDPVSAIVTALRGHDFPRALSLSQAALARQPGDYRIWTLRGMAEAGTGNPPLALTAFKHALKLSPAYLPALEGAAQTEFQLGSEDPTSLFQQILAQRPNDPTSHAVLGVLEYRKKDCAAAIVHFQKAAVAIGGQPAALTEYGTCLDAAGRGDEAIAVFSQVLALDPQKSEARYNLALAQWNEHHADDALNTLQPLTETTPVDGDVLELAADILESKNETPRAVELLRKALLSDPKNLGVYLRFAALSFDHASPQVGIDMVDFGLTQLPNEPNLYLVRGILLTQLGEFSRAADDFETANRIDPKLEFIGEAEGLVRSQQHNPAEALAKFREAVKAHPNEAYAHYLLAEALLEDTKQVGSAEYNEELRAANRAVELDPHLVAAQDLLSTVCMEGGQSEQAIRHSRAALALDPNDQQAIYHLVLLLRKTDDKDQVPVLLKRLVALRAANSQNGKAGKPFRLSEGSGSAASTPR